MICDERLSYVSFLKDKERCWSALEQTKVLQLKAFEEIFKSFWNLRNHLKNVLESILVSFLENFYLEFKNFKFQ